MSNFWDFSVWGWVILFAILLGSLLVGNVLKKSIPWLQESLIPTSVLGGIILLIVAAIYKTITGEVMFDTAIFNGNGTANLEVITYHTLALGFIASAFKTTNNKLTKQRSAEIFNTGVTTVATYLIQGIFGLAITIVAALIVKGFFPAAGVLLPFGFGQGTGQALNYGTIYETDFGFVGGKSFGLTIAALGFLSGSAGSHGQDHDHCQEQCKDLFHVDFLQIFFFLLKSVLPGFNFVSGSKKY
jgi:ESS family glutamate:Na+ symporter